MGSARRTSCRSAAGKVALYSAAVRDAFVALAFLQPVIPTCETGVMIVESMLDTV